MYGASLAILALLAVGGAGASERTTIRARLVLVDACTVHAREHASPDPVRVTCSSAQPYRIDSGRNPGLPMAGGAAAPGGPAPLMTVTF